MKKNDSPEPNESFSGKAAEVGKRIVKIGKIVLVLLLIVGMVYVLKSCGIIGNHEKPDDSDETSIEQEYDDFDDESEDYGDDEIDEDEGSSSQIDKNGEYTTAEDVAEYIHTYHKLPSNYVKKWEAKAKGWHKGEDPSEYGIMIGGNAWDNNEGLLPDDDYHECDVDYDGNGRGPNRLIYTKDGTVYYTNDHYESFTQLY